MDHWGSPCFVKLLCLWCLFVVVVFFFCFVHLFLNPVTEVVTFHGHGWFMLCEVFLLACSHLGHQCQDHWSLCNGMQVCTDRPWFILSSKRVLGSRAETLLNSRKKSPQLDGSMEGLTRSAASCRIGSTTASWAVPAPSTRPPRRVKPIMLYHAGELATLLRELLWPHCSSNHDQVFKTFSVDGYPSRPGLMSVYCDCVS